MGAGRRVQTVLVDSSYEAKTAHQRHLNKRDLGGVIFVCSNETMSECLRRQLFGLPKAHLNYVQNIEEDLPLFLFNYDEKLLHGVYAAAGPGGFNIEPHAWAANENAPSKYPAQVRVKLSHQCLPVHEKSFSRAIRENYYAAGRFMLELTKKQTHEILSMFKDAKPAPSKAAPITNAWRTVVKEEQPEGISNASSWKSVVKGDAGVDKPGVIPNGSLWSEVVKESPGPKVAAEKKKGVEPAVDKSQYFETTCYMDGTNGVAADVAEKVLQQEEIFVWHPQEEEEPVLDRILENLQVVEPTEQQKREKVASMEREKLAKDIAARGREKLEREAIERENIAKLEREKLASMQASMGNAMAEVRDSKFHLHQVMEELRIKGECLRELDIVRARNAELTLKNIELQKEIQFLKSEIEKLKQNFQEMWKPVSSMYLIGGFNGSDRLSTVERIVFNNGTLKYEAVNPLLSPRSCAAAAVLKQKVYVFGGIISGQNWINTVDRYDPETNLWSPCQSMKISRGMLSGVSLGDRLYAIGGRNAETVYPYVEFFDEENGWLESVPMQEKRSAMAAVATGGSIYAYGGTDGHDYTDSAERFDPRESVWSKLPPMTSRRVWFSSAVLDGKIYALGGFDGRKFLDTVERFDIRAGKWESAENLCFARAHCAAAVIGGSICILGGLDAKHTYVHTLELYKEGTGWETQQLPGLSQRSLLCAVAL